MWQRSPVHFERFATKLSRRAASSAILAPARAKQPKKGDHERTSKSPINWALLHEQVEKNDALRAEINKTEAAEKAAQEVDRKRKGVSKYQWRGANTVEKPELPGLLVQRPIFRTTRDRPRALGISYENACETYRIDQEVEVECFRNLPHGCQVLINGVHRGMIHARDYTCRMKPGEFRKAYVQAVRQNGPRGRIDLSFERISYESRMEDCMFRIVRVLRHCEGSMKVGDRSDPDVIRDLFQMSKENFRKACARLYVCKIIGFIKEKPYQEPQLFLRQQTWDIPEALEWFRRKKKFGDSWNLVGAQYQAPPEERLGPRDPPKVFKWIELPGHKSPSWMPTSHPLVKKRNPTKDEQETLDALKLPPPVSGEASALHAEFDAPDSPSRDRPR